MSSDRPKHKRSRAGNFESLEHRLMFSAVPLPLPATAWVASATKITTHEATGGSTNNNNISDSYALQTYGLDGFGQTVVIIDSGIAYDHYALGGGMGSSYRVVGGWDFAENDADPYDDGPTGFHGTHIAGIVGSSDSLYTGVASGVDLVALRVIDDHGNSSFDWIESALAWVHNHRNAFENPITTVNMSVGSDWNSDQIPDWTMLENELQLLKNDGIFVSVSAGNNFNSYQPTGLSYPAASPYVVPVASLDAAGLLSNFSQRQNNILAAPGENIMSTAPDYLYGFDGVTDDFVAASGTSMAAPQVAGASVLLRQAMEALGHSNIDQEDLVTILRSTANSSYDAASEVNYERVDLHAALDSVVPTDDYGSSAAAAYQIAAPDDTYFLSGIINSTTDQDHFAFSADEAGELTIEMLWMSDVNSAASLAVNGQTVGTTATIDVQAGQSYYYSVDAGRGIGRYLTELSFARETNDAPRSVAAPVATVATRMSWQADTSGTYEVAISIDDPTRATRLEIRNGQGQLAAAANNPRANEVFTISASQGELFYIDLGGNSGMQFDVTSVTDSSGGGGAPTTSATALAQAMAIPYQTQRRVHVDDVLVESGPLHELPAEEIDAALRGWQRLSKWIESMAARDASTRDDDGDGDNDVGCLEVYSFHVDEAVTDIGSWRR